jgi:hypothetical protein
VTAIRVTTTVDIIDNLGQPVTSLCQSTTALPGDNSRFWSTYTRGACQQVEHAIANMLIAQYGDSPHAASA